MILGNKNEGNSIFTRLFESSPPENFLEQLTYGIRHTIENFHESPIEIYSVEKINESLYRSESYSITNPETQNSFKITEKSAKAFTILREKIFNITKEIFSEEWNLPKERLTAKTGAGRSGSLFCYSKTKRFIGKTIPKSEVGALHLFLPQYYEYMKLPQNSKNSLIMKLLGLYHYQSTNFDIHLLIFENVLWAPIEDYYPNYHLENNTLNNNINNINNNNNNNSNDNNNTNNNNSSNDNNNMNVIESDKIEGELESGSISDTSILRDSVKNINITLLPIDHIYDLKGRLNKTKRYHAEEIEIEEEKKTVKKDKYLERLFYFGESRDFIIGQLKRDVALLSNANLMDYSLLIGIHDVTHEDQLFLSSNAKGFHAFGQVYLLGIIDCLTYYGAVKKMAQGIKSFLWTKDQLSTVEAQYYSERFLQYFDGVFQEGSPSSEVKFKPRDAKNKLIDLEVAVSSIATIILDVFTRSDLSHDPITLTARTNFESAAVESEVKVYDPKVFSALQKLFQIDLKEFQNELTIPSIQFRATFQEQESLNPFRPRIFLPSCGKRYLIQTISSREIDNLLSIAGDYYFYLSQFKQSFLIRVVAAFRVTTSIFQQLYIVIMLNPFYSNDLAYDTIYNIHGDNIEIDPYLPQVKIKSHNFGFPKFENLISSENRFRFGEDKGEIISILTRDTFFLQDKGHIDYSLLIAKGEFRTRMDERKWPLGVSRYVDEDKVAQICGITSIWKRFGRRERFSTILARGLSINPSSYAIQLLKMLNELLY